MPERPSESSQQPAVRSPGYLAYPAAGRANGSMAAVLEKDRTVPFVLGEERKETLLAYWRNALTGAAQPDILPIPPEVEEKVRQEFPGMASPTAWKQACEEYALRRLYGGHWVVYLDSPRGLVVLAVGKAEATLFVQAIPPEQWRGGQTTYPPPWDEDAGE